MKIYNEIAIDMNPESPSYGETLHEDSFEYEGPMALAIWGNRVGDPIMGNDGVQYQLRGRKATFSHDYKRLKVYDMAGSHKKTTHTNRSRAEADKWFSTWMKNNAGGVAGSGGPAIGKFSYTEGEVDPTSEEFRESVKTTGGYGELAEAFGEKGKYFEELYDKPLEFISTERQMGEQKLTTETGKSLFDIKQATDVKMAETGFATSGTVLAEEEKAKGGVFQDYRAQQEQLAFAQEKDIESFWKTEEDKFYERLTEVEGL